MEECAGLNQGELQGTSGKAEALVSNPVNRGVPRPHLPDLAVVSAILRRTCGFHSHFFMGEVEAPRKLASPRGRVSPGNEPSLQASGAEELLSLLWLF